MALRAHRHRDARSDRLMRVLRVLAVAAVAALLGLLVWDVANSGGSKVASSVDAGKVVAAPKLALPYHDRDGTFDLAALRGKVVVVNFWASWCLGCKKEAPALNAAARQWRDRGVVFVGVDVNDFRGAASRFLDRARRAVLDRPRRARLDAREVGRDGAPRDVLRRPQGPRRPAARARRDHAREARRGNPARTPVVRARLTTKSVPPSRARRHDSACSVVPIVLTIETPCVLDSHASIAPRRRASS